MRRNRRLLRPSTCSCANVHARLAGFCWSTMHTSSQRNHAHGRPKFPDATSQCSAGAEFNKDGRMYKFAPLRLQIVLKYICSQVRRTPSVGAPYQLWWAPSMEGPYQAPERNDVLYIPNPPKAESTKIGFSVVGMCTCLFRRNLRTAALFLALRHGNVVARSTSAQQSFGHHFWCRKAQIS